MKKNKGITLIALVITIIVLLILAGVTIASLSGSGLFEKARQAEEKQKIAEGLEKLNLIAYEAQIKNNGAATLEDFVNILNGDKEHIYAVKIGSNIGIVTNMDTLVQTEIKSAPFIIVTYNGYEYKITKELKITFIGDGEKIENITYKVTYYKNDGTEEKLEETEELGEILSNDIFTRNGYIFVGWYREPECTGTAIQKVNGNMNLYAKWEAEVFVDQKLEFPTITENTICNILSISEINPNNHIYKQDISKGNTTNAESFPIECYNNDLSNSTYIRYNSGSSLTTYKYKANVLEEAWGKKLKVTATHSSLGTYYLRINCCSSTGKVLDYISFSKETKVAKDITIPNNTAYIGVSCSGGDVYIYNMDIEKIANLEYPLITSSAIYNIYSVLGGTPNDKQYKLDISKGNTTNAASFPIECYDNDLDSSTYIKYDSNSSLIEYKYRANVLEQAWGIRLRVTATHSSNETNYLRINCYSADGRVLNYIDFSKEERATKYIEIPRDTLYIGASCSGGDVYIYNIDIEKLTDQKLEFPTITSSSICNILTKSEFNPNYYYYKLDTSRGNTTNAKSFPIECYNNDLNSSTYIRYNSGSSLTEYTHRANVLEQAWGKTLKVTATHSSSGTYYLRINCYSATGEVLDYISFSKETKVTKDISIPNNTAYIGASCSGGNVHIFNMEVR